MARMAERIWRGGRFRQGSFCRIWETHKKEKGMKRIRVAMAAVGAIVLAACGVPREAGQLAARRRRRRQRRRPTMPRFRQRLQAGGGCVGDARRTIAEA